MAAGAGHRWALEPFMAERHTLGRCDQKNEQRRPESRGITYGDLAHELTDNEFVADETVKVIATITQKHAL